MRSSEMKVALSLFECFWFVFSVHAAASPSLETVEMHARDVVMQARDRDEWVPSYFSSLDVLVT